MSLAKLEDFDAHKAFADRQSRDASTVREKCPKLWRYLMRVGATVSSFRHAAIYSDQESRYARQVARIDWKDGKIVCVMKEYAPTPEEATAIDAELAEAELPKSILVLASRGKPINLPAPKGKDVASAEEFRFYDRSGDSVVFIHRRVLRASKGRDETRDYEPWTYFSDGQWRMLEPDGKLPLFGLEQIDRRLIGKLGDSRAPAPRFVFVHEGASSAAKWQRIIEGKAPAEDLIAARRHPWFDTLNQGIHLGWPGGAPNPQRVDWTDVTELGKKGYDVILVCDNDQVGKEAAPKIAKLTGQRFSAILFDDRFPRGFDLGDDFPESDRGRRPWFREAGEKRIYTGPALDDLKIPVVWATRTIATGQPGRRGHEITNEFAAEWSFSVKPEVFVHRGAPHRLRSAAEFNIDVRSLSHVDDTAKLLRKRISSKVDSVTYRPDMATGLITTDEGRAINTYRPPSIQPLNGDPKPWLAFMKYLIPQEADREKLMRWIATLVAHPEVRMHYSVLLMSEMQGVGKSTLADAILRPLVGKSNTSVIDARALVDSAFNAWAVGKRLGIVAEIYEGSSWRAYNKLKPLITDEKITINQKYLAEYEVDNWIHLFASSNSKQALRIDNDDRRWLIPEVSEEKWPRGDWEAFYGWLNDDGLGIIAGWAANFAKELGPVRKGEEAPDTSTKRQMVEDSMTERQKWVRDFGNALLSSSDRCLVTIDEVRGALAGAFHLQLGTAAYERLESHARIRSDLHRHCITSEGKKLHFSDKQFKIDGRMQRLVANFDFKEARDDRRAAKASREEFEAVRANGSLLLDEWRKM